MLNSYRRYWMVILAVAGMGPGVPAIAQGASSGVGVVVLHGKGVMPSSVVSELATFLEGQGAGVANLEMPWSKRRQYDVDVAAAEAEVIAALATLRARGARQVFVAGHSQGGVFALHFGGRHVVNGIVAIAPGGDVASDFFREKLNSPVRAARRQIEQGHGNEKGQFYDYEGSKGSIPVVTTAAIYFNWFDPEGAMNQTRAVKHLNPTVPVLYVAPQHDIRALRFANPGMFEALPRNPLTRLYEPDSNHVQAPIVAREEIWRWIGDVVSRAGPATAGSR